MSHVIPLKSSIAHLYHTKGFANSRALLRKPLLVFTIKQAFLQDEWLDLRLNEHCDS